MASGVGTRSLQRCASSVTSPGSWRPPDPAALKYTKPCGVGTRSTIAQGLSRTHSNSPLDVRPCAQSSACSQGRTVSSQAERASLTQGTCRLEVVIILDLGVNLARQVMYHSASVRCCYALPGMESRIIGNPWAMPWDASRSVAPLEWHGWAG